MADFTDQAWDGAASRFKDTDAYCSSCLIDENEPGQDKIQALCSLPVQEPDGAYNTNAIHNAVARLSQVKASPASKKKAASRLKSLYSQMGVKRQDMPETLTNMAQ